LEKADEKTPRPFETVSVLGDFSWKRVTYRL